MDSCQKFKDWLLTDHIDGELKDNDKAQLDAHLGSCPECRTFAAEVQKNLGFPFEHVPREEVPAHVWSAIKTQIQESAESKERPIFSFEKFMSFLFVPRLAVVGLAVVILIGGMSFYYRQVEQAKDVNEQVEYFAVLLGTDEDFSDVDAEDSQTSIEEYFL